ncbi:cilia- and flagella-associated protein 410-like isoform X2 [Mercenaria mercenaria]|nr:cilia- and flagella-associated protein 410-like isoform X2 [Mercenaria mercenaria]
MPNLEICSVSVNDITTLRDFEECENLQELYIRNNKIQNLTDICYLKGLEKLRILWLADNPCANRENYRLTVIRNLPHLQKLDNVVVEDEERTAAKDQGEELSLPDPDQGSEQSEDKTVSNGETTPAGDAESKEAKALPKDPVTLSWEETNKIREQLGLKPLPIEKIGSPKSAPTHSTRTRNAHVLQAVLILVKELDRDSLEIVETAIRKRIETL